MLEFWRHRSALTARVSLLLLVAVQLILAAWSKLLNSFQLLNTPETNISTNFISCGPWKRNNPG